MRLLYLSNFYPPVRAGGYAQLCHEVAQRLEARGHTVGVLTSDYQQERAPADEQYIYRRLHLEGDLFYYQPAKFFLNWPREQRENQAILARTVEDFRPDLILVWGMWALSSHLPALAEQLLGSRVVYYLADYWPVSEDMHTAYWHLPADHGFMRLPKQLLRGVAMKMLSRAGTPRLKFENTLCVSGVLRDLLIEKGAPLQQAKVVHNGIDVQPFLDAGRQMAPRGNDSRLQLLYAGQLVSHKGVHTAVEAVARLVHNQDIHQVALTILGTGHPEYEANLRALVEQQKLGDYVTFHPLVDREQMPATLAQFDALVFPSIYEEPLARIVQEAMATGLVIIGTTTGGTREILTEGQTGLTFDPGNAEQLAKQIASLINNPDLGDRLAVAGRQVVVDHFNLDRMTDEIEQYLQGIVTDRATNPLRYAPV